MNCTRPSRCVYDRSLLVEWRGAESAEEASNDSSRRPLILDINASRASLSEGVAAQLGSGRANGRYKAKLGAEDAARV